MYNFRNDYSEGAHPNILQKLIETNLIQQSGYGEDEYSLQAKHILQQKIENPDAAIYFVSGGMQTNLLVISALLKIHEAVISANTRHIFSHETGADAEAEINEIKNVNSYQPQKKRFRMKRFF